MRGRATRFLLTGSLALVLSLGVGALVYGLRGTPRDAPAGATGGQRPERRRPPPPVGPARAGAGGRAAPHRARIARRGRAGADGGQDAAAVARRSVPAERDERASTRRGTSVDAALQSARQLSRLLHPPMLDDMGLGPRSTGISRRSRNAPASPPSSATRDWRSAGPGNRNLPVPHRPGSHHQRRPSRRGDGMPGLRAAAAGSVVLTVEDNGRGFDRPARCRGRRRARAARHPGTCRRMPAGCFAWKARPAEGRASTWSCRPRAYLARRSARPADADDDGTCRRQTMVRILLADDHTLVRQGIRRILEEHADWQVVGGSRATGGRRSG